MSDPNTQLIELLLAADRILVFTGAGDADLALALGSSLTAQPAAPIPLLAVERGTPYIIINRGVTDHDGLAGLTLRIDGDVVEELPPAVASAIGNP